MLSAGVMKSPMREFDALETMVRYYEGKAEVSELTEASRFFDARRFAKRLERGGIGRRSGVLLPLVPVRGRVTH